MGLPSASGELTWLEAALSVLTGWWACSGGGWDMAVCRGRWCDVGACWSLGSCGVSCGLDGAPVSATFDPVWVDPGGGRSLGLCGTVWGLGWLWLCSRSFGSFFVRGGVVGREVEEEEGWLG